MHKTWTDTLEHPSLKCDNAWARKVTYMISTLSQVIHGEIKDYPSLYLDGLPASLLGHFFSGDVIGDTVNPVGKFANGEGVRSVGKGGKEGDPDDVREIGLRGSALGFGQPNA
jgi:hypothetical protein